jgi:hemerythrin-like domain-containing protein
MQATDILMSEHRVIEQVLNCLEKMAHQCIEDKALDAAAARQIVDFFQTFADHCHHAKEEEYLFPLLEARGFVRAHGPTGVMLYEHELGRLYLRSMAAVIERAAKGELDALRLFAGQARSYVELLRGHIAKEDQRLFPMANQRLTDQDQQILLDAFDDVENHQQHADTHAQYLRIADELAERFHMPRVSVESVASQGCCSCSRHG